MRIELELFNAIINTPLFPSGSSLAGGYDRIKHQLGNTPNNIEESKEWIQRAVGDKIKFTYSLIPTALPASIFVRPSKSEYIPDKYPLRFRALSLEGSLYKRIYKSLIDWECYRIHNTLLQFAEGVNQDARLRVTIKETLNHIYSLIDEIWYFYEHGIGPEPRCSDPNAHPEENQKAIQECNEIMFYLLNSMVRLYYEIVIAFKEFCIDYEPILGTIEGYKHYLIGKDSLSHEYDTLLAAHNAQQAIAQNDIDAIKSAVESLRPLFNPADTSNVIAIATEADNALFSAADNISTITKSSIKKQLEVSQDPRQIVGFIENIIEQFYTQGIVPLTQESIPGKLLSYLNEQKEIYLKYWDSSFVPIGSQKEPRATRITPALKARDKKKIYTEAKKILEHFSGYNLNSEKIMSDTDYTRLLEYVKEAIEKEAVPGNIAPINSIKLTQAHVRHTIYKINELMYAKKRDTFWLDFILAAFFMFSETTRDSLYRNWAKVGPYERDLENMKKISNSMK